MIDVFRLCAEVIDQADGLLITAGAGMGVILACQTFEDKRVSDRLILPCVRPASTSRPSPARKPSTMMRAWPGGSMDTV